MTQDVLVKISPRHFGNPFLDPLDAGIELLRAIPITGLTDRPTRGQRPRREMNADDSRGARGGVVTCVTVGLDTLLQKPIQPLVGLVLARWPEAAQTLSRFGVKGLVLGGCGNGRFEDGREALACGRGIPLGWWECVEQAWIGGEVCDPCAPPGRVDAVLLALAGMKCAWRHNDVVVYCREADALFQTGGRESRLTPQLINFVLDVAKDVLCFPLGA